MRVLDILYIVAIVILALEMASMRSRLPVKKEKLDRRKLGNLKQKADRRRGDRK